MQTSVPTLRFTIPEAAQALRCSRGLIYKRAKSGALRIQKDGANSYVTADELRRYVASLDQQQSAA